MTDFDRHGFDRKQKLTLTKTFFFFLKMKIPIISSSKQFNWTCGDHLDQWLTRWLQCRAGACRVPSVNQWAFSLQTRAVNTPLIPGQHMPFHAVFDFLHFFVLVHIKEGNRFERPSRTSFSRCVVSPDDCKVSGGLWECTCTWTANSRPVQTTVRLNLKKLHWCMNDT